MPGWIAAIRGAWLRIHQPRVISALYCAIYLALAYAGITSFIAPPRSVEGVIGQVAVTTLALLLVLGGLLGAPAALRGIWWLERIAVASIAFSASIYGAIVLTLEIQSSTGNRQLQLMFILVVLLMQAVRWHRIRVRPYDPGHGAPETGEE